MNDVCPVCKGEISRNNPALYAMGWRVVVCSRECLGKLHERLRAWERMTDHGDYRGPDGIKEHQGGQTD